MVEEYRKLVRNRIPELIRQNDETPVTHAASDDEYRDRLYAKLDEEVGEFRESGDVEELADVLEVVYAIGELEGLSDDELRELRAETAAERGRFEERIILETVHR